MRDFGRDVGFLRDAEQLVQRSVDALPFIAHVRRVDAAVPPGGFGEGDELIGLGIAGGCVLERGPDTEPALLHKRVDDRRHVRELGGGGSTIRISDHRETNLCGAHERRDVERGALLLELREIAVEIAPVLAVMPFLHRVRIVQDQLVRERCNRAAFSCDFGGNDLRDLREDAIVDEHVGLGLAHHVDEAGRDDQTVHIEGLTGRRRAEKPDRGDPITAQRDVALVTRIAAAVDNPPAFENQIVGAVTPGSCAHASQGDK